MLTLATAGTDEYGSCEITLPRSVVFQEMSQLRARYEGADRGDFHEDDLSRFVLSDPVGVVRSDTLFQLQRYLHPTLKTQLPGEDAVAYQAHVNRARTCRVDFMVGQMNWEECYRFMRFVDFYCAPTDPLHDLLTIRMNQRIQSEGFTGAPIDRSQVILDFGPRVLCSHHSGASCNIEKSDQKWEVHREEPAGMSYGGTSPLFGMLHRSTLDVHLRSVPLEPIKKKASSASSSTSDTSSVAKRGREVECSSVVDHMTVTERVTKRFVHIPQLCGLDDDMHHDSDGTDGQDVLANSIAVSDESIPSLDRRFFSGGYDIDKRVTPGPPHITPFHLMPPSEYLFMLQIASAFGFAPCSYRPLFACNNRAEIMFHTDYVSFLHNLPRGGWMEWQWIELLSRPLIRAGHIRSALFHLYDSEHEETLRTITHATRAVVGTSTLKEVDSVVDGDHDNNDNNDDNDDDDGTDVLTRASSTITHNESDWMALSTMWPLVDSLGGVPVFQPSEKAALSALEQSLLFQTHLDSDSADQNSSVTTDLNALQLCSAFNVDPVSDPSGFANAHMTPAGGLVARILASDALQCVLREHHCRFNYHSDMDIFVVGQSADAKRSLVERVLDHPFTQGTVTRPPPIVGLLPGVIIFQVAHCTRLVQIILSDASDVASLLFNFDFSFLQCAVDNGRVMVTPQFMVDHIQGTATPNKLWGPTQSRFRDFRVFKALDKGRFVPTTLVNAQSPTHTWRMSELSLYKLSSGFGVRQMLRDARHRYLHWRPARPCANASSNCNSNSVALITEERRHMFHLVTKQVVNESIGAFFRFYDDIGRRVGFSDRYLRPFSCQWAHPYFLPPMETGVLSSSPSSDYQKSTQTDKLSHTGDKLRPLFISASTLLTDRLDRLICNLVSSGVWKYLQKETRPRYFRLPQPIHFEIEHAYVHVSTQSEECLIVPTTDLLRPILQHMCAVWSCVIRALAASVGTTTQRRTLGLLSKTRPTTTVDSMVDTDENDSSHATGSSTATEVTADDDDSDSDSTNVLPWLDFEASLNKSFFMQLDATDPSSPAFGWKAPVVDPTTDVSRMTDGPPVVFKCVKLTDIEQRMQPGECRRVHALLSFDRVDILPKDSATGIPTLWTPSSEYVIAPFFKSEHYRLFQGYTMHGESAHLRR